MRCNDALRMLRGAGAVVVSGVAESRLAGRVAGGDLVPVLRAAAELLRGAGHRTPADATPAPPLHDFPAAASPSDAPPPPAGARASPFAGGSGARAYRGYSTLPLPPPAAAAAAAAHPPPLPSAAAAAAAAGAAAAAEPAGAPAAPQPGPSRAAPPPRRTRSVPATPFARVLGFGSLAATLAVGTVADAARRAWRGGGDPSSSSPSGAWPHPSSSLLTEANAERVAAALCGMRGAALKLGQMLSIQDENILPPAIARALAVVRAGADAMPPSQLHAQLSSELGPGWRSGLSSFDEAPIAAASIGQVHAATLADGVTRVAMKVQYPGVAASIESDIDNLLALARLTDALPRGLYVQEAVRVAKQELALECDYRWEAAAQERFRGLLSGDPSFLVPPTVPHLCTRRVLTTAFVPGVAVDAALAGAPQGERDAVGAALLRLTLRELFEFRFMQTDPNFANFLYHRGSGAGAGAGGGGGGGAGVLALIDFGAAKEYPRPFVDTYLRMVAACARRDRAAVLTASRRLGFLTGDESGVMLDAHTEAAFVVGLPFAQPGLFDFGAAAAGAGSLTRRVGELGAVMLKHRLTPPPELSYSLHRKLSGAFLTCMRIGARVPCHDLFHTALAKWEAGEYGDKPAPFTV